VEVVAAPGGWVDLVLLEDLAVEVVVQAVDRADSALPGGVAVEVAA